MSSTTWARICSWSPPTASPPTTRSTPRRSPTRAEYWRLTRESLTRVYADLRAGANGRTLFERSAEPYIAAGYPTQLTKEPGTVLEDGYFHGLGHGVGLEVHERPFMGRLGDDLLAGEVVTVEPGCYRRGFGGCRLEDLVLVTEDGYEVLTDFPYEL